MDKMYILIGGNMQTTEGEKEKLGDSNPLTDESTLALVLVLLFSGKSSCSYKDI